ncbi:hypothetical protein JHK82_029483 [Glycine max]|nr:hypothetical protein JHK82_029483 [Glycine max]
MLVDDAKHGSKVDHSYMWHACHGEELGADPHGTSDGLYTPDYDDVDEFEQWLLEADIDSDYEEMGDAENNDEMVM